MSNKIIDSLRALLADTIDYAGLFPPSKVSMETAVRNYAEYLKSEHRWMLGRFVVPVIDLDEFIDVQRSLETSKKVWRLSVIAGEDVLADLEKIRRVNEKHLDYLYIETIEVKADSPAKIRETTGLLPENLISYFEIPTATVLTDSITAIALTKTRAKIRTGGVTPEAFPPVDEIVKFMRICTAANIPFKATAGLHHPLRCHKPLTYEENAVKGAMNGFLNLFLVAVFLRQNLNHTFVHELMKDGDVGNFKFTDDAVSWKDHTASVSEIESARKRGIISFGSCSFTEPVEDLQEIDLL